MPNRNEDAWGGHESPQRRGTLARAAGIAVRALEAEAERWFLWLPVLFAAGIVTYFALSTEPEPRIAVALLLAALGLLLTVRQIPVGLALGGACLAFALGFTTAQLRTEAVRAPVLASELRHVPVAGFVEKFETRRDKRDRLTLRVIAVGDLGPDTRPYRVRISTASKLSLIHISEPTRRTPNSYA